jgi:hypothetical protein
MAITIIEQKYISAINISELNAYNADLDPEDRLTAEDAAELLIKALNECSNDLLECLDHAWDSRKEQAKDYFLTQQWNYNDYLNNLGIDDLISREDFFYLLEETL